MGIRRRRSSRPRPPPRRRPCRRGGAPRARQRWRADGGRRRPRAAPGRRASGSQASGRVGSSPFRGARDAVGLELPPEVDPPDAERLGGPGDVPVVGPELAENVRALEGVPGLPEALEARRRPAPGRPPASGAAAGDPRARWVAGRHDDEPLDHVAELAHVARPVVRHEGAHGLAGERLGALPVLRRERLQEVLDQERDVLSPAPERRHLHRDDVQPVEEVLAEAALGDQIGQRLVRGGDHPHVDPDRLVPADPLHRLLLQRPQHLGLGPERHVADLVEEERAARRPARTSPAAAPMAPVKAPFSWPNSSDSISSSGMAAQLTSTNGWSRRVRTGRGWPARPAPCRRRSRRR